MKRHPALEALFLTGLLAGCASGKPSERQEPARSDLCTPNLPCWPSPAEWQQLRSSLRGELVQPRSPLSPCEVKAESSDCARALDHLKNPFFIQDSPGGTQSMGWLGAWKAAPSAYAVIAVSPSDIVGSVNFARQHRLRLVIKGTGHDYLGRSSAPDSLLVWTHKMRQVTVHDAFTPQGCRQGQPATPAVTVEAGTRWLEAYQEVTVKHHRYVQGGGCTSVGAAGGFTQGGGFGSWSKKFGTAAAGMLEAEVVTADGRLLVANACQNADLFWALRGGGGGTYGIVTRVTLRTHPAPSSLGFVLGSVTAKTDAAFKDLLERFVRFYRQSLHNENWGEQVTVRGDNSLQLSMSFEGLTGNEAERVWLPFRSWIEQHPESFTWKANYVAVPGDKFWDESFIRQHFASAIERDTRPDQPQNLFWWATNQEEVATYWYAYQSRWIPEDRFQGAEATRLAAVLFEASRHWSLGIHFNKGQAGASTDAIARGRETSMNPAVFKAAALVIVAANGPGYPGVRGHEPDVREGEKERARVTAAMQILRNATPDAGTYVNETDYFEPNWQRELWGENYPKLLAIKRRYDPQGLFRCHHCVGSEDAPAH